jgi:GYF domain 2
MAADEAIWHVIVDATVQGPLTRAQVLEFLREGMLAGSDLIWRAGFADWKPVGEIDDFRQRPPRMSAETCVPLQSQINVSAHPGHVAEGGEPARGTKWSLWKSANIGILVGALTLVVQVVSGRGFELADYAHTGSAATISSLIGQILGAPLIFVVVAAVRNLVYWRRPKSGASAARGALTFVALLACILGALKVYGEVVFSSTEMIGGETRKKFSADTSRACVQKQRSSDANVSEAQIEKYCTCVSEKMADGTTYQQLGGELDANALADLRKKTEAAGYACR